ncbi:hypothetical protein COB57_01010 [Candidatus Peregrinibacteria bacterium]|nr:MAG: hypothetical protein COB57_01010 [Candidatus Peregrinibacteria bacterium]
MMDNNCYPKYNRESRSHLYLYIIKIVCKNQGDFFLAYFNNYVIIFKPTLDNNGVIKGNCDAELVLHCMIEYQNYDKCIIISGDGDFHCLIECLSESNKLSKVGIPNKKKYSSLLRKFNKHFFFIGDYKRKLEHIKK